MKSKIEYRNRLKFINKHGEKVACEEVVSSDGNTIFCVSVGGNSYESVFRWGQVVSGKAVVDGKVYGYEYAYDQEKQVIQLKNLSTEVDLDTSVNMYNRLQKQPDFESAKTSFVSMQYSGADFVGAKGEAMAEYKEISIIDAKQPKITYSQSREFRNLGEDINNTLKSVWGLKKLEVCSKRGQNYVTQTSGVFEDKDVVVFDIDGSTGVRRTESFYQSLSLDAVKARELVEKCATLEYFIEGHKHPTPTSLLQLLFRVKTNMPDAGESVWGEEA